MSKGIALAKWNVMRDNRAVFGTEDASSIQLEIGYDAISIQERKDKKTGKITKALGGGPKIILDPIFYHQSKKGIRLPVGKSSLFTWTTKMSCPSFSLPAGPQAMGGTCPGSMPADIKKDGSYEEFSPPLSEVANGHPFICSICYAGKGNYMMYPSVSISQVIHKLWVDMALKDGTFVDSVVSAIESIQDPAVEKVLKMKATSGKFFRIHDSGDFFSQKYYQSWCQICEALPQIKFWAPTRVWVFEYWRDVFAENPPPENLALRPSGLMLDMPPPDIDGLDAGTTSHIGKFGSGVKDCPAYMSKTRSCASAGCRTCWTEPNRPVNYWTH
jgi:hypothetical protein